MGFTLGCISGNPASLGVDGFCGNVRNFKACVEAVRLLVVSSWEQDRGRISSESMHIFIFPAQLLTPTSSGHSHFSGTKDNACDMCNRIRLLVPARSVSSSLSMAVSNIARRLSLLGGSVG